MKDDDDSIYIIPDEITITVKLSRASGQLIKDLIQENFYTASFPWYCAKVGVKGPNFYTTLNGERPCSLEQLQKILSGIGYEAVYEIGPLIIRKRESMHVIENIDHILEEEIGNNEE